MRKAYSIDEEGLYTFTDKVTSRDIVELAASIMEQRMERGATLTSPDETKRYLSLQIGTLEQEVFCCIFLDTGHRVISFERMFNGTIDGATVHPREVVKAALKWNAAAVILTHNHPSGRVEPSAADQALTRRLQEALSLVDVRLLDHIVVGGAETMSFAERGLL